MMENPITITPQEIINTILGILLLGLDGAAVTINDYYVKPHEVQ